MVHQGKILQRLVERKKITQDEMAKSMGYKARSGFIRYYKEEELDDQFIDKAAALLGVDRSVFFPEGSTVVSGTGNAVGTNNTTNVGTLADCRKELEHWMAIAKANEDRARAFELLAEERKEMIDLLKKASK